jgi:mono/diheme cytochrome c family protein
MRLSVVLSLIVACQMGTWQAKAAEPTIAITSQGKSQEYTASALLARSDAASISVPQDVSYRQSMTYRAVPLLKLLDGIHDDRFDTLEAHARDGFVAQIPLALLARGGSGGAVPWLAVEDPAHPWPRLPHGTGSAGPFYLVWEHPQQSGVSSEQWPYQVVSLSLAESPVHRWPQLALPGDRSADARARAGQKVFLTLCLPCHQLNSGGASAVGPDLGQPMNATQYLTEAGLRAIIRDPRAVRTWPQQHMSGFGEQTLPESDLDALLAYLRAMAGKSAGTTNK